MQFKHIVLQGAAQVTFQTYPIKRRSIHFSLIKLEGILANGLGMVHSGIGVLQQCAGFDAILRIQRQADAGADEKLTLLQYKGRRQHGENLLSYVYRGSHGPFLILLPC